MTDEQKEARRISAESGHIKWIKDHCLRTKEGEDDYVFISYKSDDYKIVLDDIVYNACKKYGLRVYFDTAFDDGSDSWVNQFYENMCSLKCKAFIAFINDAYYSSYATLMEMMARKTRKAGGDLRFDSLFFLPINIGDVTDELSEENTGLGTGRFKNGKINNQAEKELLLFNRLFKEIADSDSELRYIYTRENDSDLYGEKTDKHLPYGKMYLNITVCRELMKHVCPKDNENNGKNKSFVEVIHDKLINGGLGSVFGEVAPVHNGTETLVNEEKREKIPIKRGKKISGLGVGGRNEILNENTTLKEFRQYCETVGSALALRSVREKGKKQLFDYLMASLLRGCDESVSRGDEKILRLAGYNYCTYVISAKLDLENPKIGASQYTWTSNARKALRTENLPKDYFDEKGRVKSGRLGENSTIFEQLDENMTIGEVLKKYELREKGFDTKDNDSIKASWGLIKSINNMEKDRGAGEIL